MHKFFLLNSLFASALHVSGFLLAHLKRGTVYKLGSGSSILGMVLASGPGWNWYNSSGQARTLSLLQQFQPGLDADTIPGRPEPLPNLYTVPLEDGFKESPKPIRQK
jgi:hypothetical protein